MHGFELILSDEIDYSNIVSDSPERNKIFNGVRINSHTEKKERNKGAYQTPQKKLKCVQMLSRRLT